MGISEAYLIVIAKAFCFFETALCGLVSFLSCDTEGKLVRRHNLGTRKKKHPSLLTETRLKGKYCVNIQLSMLAFFQNYQLEKENMSNNTHTSKSSERK